MGPPREGVGGKWGIQAELIACAPFRCPPFADRLRVIDFLLSPVMRSLQEAGRER